MTNATPAAPTPEPRPKTLSQCLARLTEINRMLASSTLDLEVAVGLVEEGTTLHTHAEGILNAARLRVTELLASHSEAKEPVQRATSGES